MTKAFESFRASGDVGDLELWSCPMHSGEVFDSAYAIAPHLVRLEGGPKLLFEVVCFWWGLVDQQRYPTPVPSDLRPAVEAGLPAATEIARRLMRSRSLEERETVSLVEALARLEQWPEPFASFYRRRSEEARFACPACHAELQRSDWQDGYELRTGGGSSSWVGHPVSFLKRMISKGARSSPPDPSEVEAIPDIVRECVLPHANLRRIVIALYTPTPCPACSRPLRLADQP